MKLSNILESISLIICFSMMFSIFVIGDVFAANYYIATNGSNSNPGTISQPWATFSYANSQMSGGDTLFVRGGTYTQQITDLPSGTSWSNATTIKAYNNETVTLKPTSGYRVLDFVGESQYIIIDDLILDGVNVSNATVLIKGLDTGRMTKFIRVINSEVKNSPGSGLVTSYYTSDLEILNVVSHDNGPDPIRDNGFYVATSNSVLDGCIAYNNASRGISVFSNKGGNFNTIKNCKSYNNRYGIGFYTGSSHKGYNNICWGNADEGIDVWVNNVELYNNTVYNNGKQGIQLDTASNCIVRNNISYSNTLTDIEDLGSGNTIDHNFSTDPLFTDADGADNIPSNADDDLTLQSVSGAIDAGMSVGLVTDDHDGNARPNGSDYDIGAYEYGGIEMQTIKVEFGGQTPSLCAEVQDVPKYKVFERIITNDKPYENKFRDVVLTAVFTSPSGKKTTFWGFYDGDGKGGQDGNVWKLRFMPDEVGTWKYTYSWSDGTAGGSGTFRCVSAGAGKGILKPYVKNPRWVAYNGTEPVFLRSYYVGKLTHTSLDWSIKHVYQPLIDRGYNHIQYLGSLFGWMTNKFEDAPDPAVTHGTGHGSQQNLDAWKLAESHFMWLNDRNIAVHHWTGLANAYDVQYGGVDWKWRDMSAEEKEIHIRYIMSRLAPLANQAGWGFWFETSAPADFMKLVAKYDPWEHLRGHQGHYNDLDNMGRSVRPEETWVNVSFPGKYSRDSDVVHKLMKDYYEQEIGNNYTPLVLNESGLWATKGVAQQADKLRRAAWGVTTANAHFVWRWVTSGSRSAPAQAASEMFATSAEKYLEVLYDVMSKEVAFGEMRSHGELLTDAAETTFCLAQVGQQYLVYDEAGGSFGLKVASQTYNATWIDTKTGEKTTAGVIKGTGSVIKFTTPNTSTDWVLVLSVRQ